jgi:hypothetical protein
MQEEDNTKKEETMHAGGGQCTNQGINKESERTKNEG